MNPIKAQEQLHVTEIVAELEKIEKILRNEAGLEETPRGLLAMKVAAKAYLNITTGLFPVDFRIPQMRECSQFVASSLDIARSFRAISNKRGLRKIKDHLNLIGKAGFGASATITNQQDKAGRIGTLLDEQEITETTNEIRKDATRKSLELMLGLAALGRFGDVSLEDPNCSSSSAPNPDVIIPFNGENYGIACKSICTRNYEGLRDNIKKAISQLKKAAESNALTPGRGLVFLDVSPLLNHEELYLPDQPGTIWYRDTAKETCQRAVATAFARAAGMNAPDDAHALFGDLFKDRVVAPVIIVYGHTVMIADYTSQGAPGYMKSMWPVSMGDASRINPFVNQLNFAIHAQPGPGKKAP